MGFGELVAVVPGHPARSRVGLGPHRQLDKVHLAQRLGDQPEPGGVDHVLRILEDHPAKALAAPRLVVEQGRVEVVQAIGLCGRAVLLQHHHPRPAILSHACLGRGDGRGVVRIAADIEPQARLGPGAERIGDRRADDLGLAPGGEEDRDRAVQRFRELPGGQPRGRRPPGQAQSYPEDIDRQIVDRADGEPEQGESRQFALGKLKPVQNRLNRQRPPFAGSSSVFAPRRSTYWV